MEGHYTAPTQPAVALSFLCILLHIIKTSFDEATCESEQPFVQPCNFYNGFLNYYHFDRVGGVLSHLKRHYHSQLETVLGKGHSYLLPTRAVPGSVANGPDLSDICKILKTRVCHRKFS